MTAIRARADARSSEQDDACVIPERHDSDDDGHAAELPGFPKECAAATLGSNAARRLLTRARTRHADWIHFCPDDCTGYFDTPSLQCYTYFVANAICFAVASGTPDKLSSVYPGGCAADAARGTVGFSAFQQVWGGCVRACLCVYMCMCVYVLQWLQFLISVLLRMAFGEFACAFVRHASAPACLRVWLQEGWRAMSGLWLFATPPAAFDADTTCGRRLRQHTLGCAFRRRPMGRGERGGAPAAAAASWCAELSRRARALQAAYLTHGTFDFPRSSEVLIVLAAALGVLGARVCGGRKCGGGGGGAHARAPPPPTGRGFEGAAVVVARHALARLATEVLHAPPHTAASVNWSRLNDAPA